MTNFHKLPLFLKKKEIELDKIPEIFRKDLISFIFGSTVKKNMKGKICINRTDYREWLKKIWFKGFDYPINLNENKRNYSTRKCCKKKIMNISVE